MELTRPSAPAYAKMERARLPAERRQVVLCDEHGTRLGTAFVSEVHDGGGILHKAFSVFVFRRDGGEVLLQRRSHRKNLFPLRWANTCCSHLAPSDRDVRRAAVRRLQEELGFSVALSEAGAFVYRAQDPTAPRSEYEHDTVLVGHLRRSISIRADPAEVVECNWVRTATLQRDLLEHPEEYAPWLPEALSLAVHGVPHR